MAAKKTGKRAPKTPRKKPVKKCALRAVAGKTEKMTAKRPGAKRWELQNKAVAIEGGAHPVLDHVLDGDSFTMAKRMEEHVVNQWYPTRGLLEIVAGATVLAARYANFLAILKNVDAEAAADDFAHLCRQVYAAVSQSHDRPGHYKRPRRPGGKASREARAEIRVLVDMAGDDGTGPAELKAAVVGRLGNEVAFALALKQLRKEGRIRLVQQTRGTVYVAGSVSGPMSAS